jgi:type II secretory ATPase GspE/PulE/Tfp pilus assembly ATPase PilB-like protein
MSDVFISHVEKDCDIALRIAGGLDQAGCPSFDLSNLVCAMSSSN